MNRLLMRFTLQALGAAGVLALMHRVLGPDGQRWLSMALILSGFGFQFFSFQKLWAEKMGSGAATALANGQLGWILLALGLSAQGLAGGLGALNLCLQQFVLTLPLALLLEKRSAGDTGLFSLTGLALAGCIPFSAFPAYFQTFLPLMGVGQNVASMHEKLFTGPALLGTLAIFAIIVQTAALGSSLLVRLNAPQEQEGMGVAVWGWGSLALSLLLGLERWKVAGILSEVLKVLVGK
jgi:hypothetical protein